MLAANQRLGQLLLIAQQDVPRQEPPAAAFFIYTD